MSTGGSLSYAQRSAVVLGILCVSVCLVSLQLWLLMATTNAHLGGDSRVVWPAAVTSGACFLLNLGLLRYLARLDEE